MISIDRLAMEIAAKRCHVASKILERHGFSPAERSEIIASHFRQTTDSVDPDWRAVAGTIRSTMGCSVRTGYRIDMNI